MTATADQFQHASPASGGQPAGGSRAGRLFPIIVVGTPAAGMSYWLEGPTVSYPGWYALEAGNRGNRADYYSWMNNASTNSQGLPATTAGLNSDFKYRKPGSSVVHSIPLHANAANDTVVYGGGTGFLWRNQPAITLTFEGDQVTDVDVPGEQKQYKEGWILIDNQTGEAKNIQFGDETIRAEPGINVYPFYGEVDPNTGLPKAFPPGFIGEVVQGPDGQNYFGGRLGFHPEGGVEWQPFPFTISPPPSSGQGPILNTPSPTGNGNTQYQLPPGMTPGSNLPLPPGMTPGGTVNPPGVGNGGSGPSPNPNVPSGSNGSLPNGTISGGSGHLPEGVSPGVVSNPNGSQTGSGTIGGGSTATDTEGTADGDWDGGDAVQPGVQHNVAGKVDALRGVIGSKLGDMIPDFGNGGLPRTNVLTVNIPVAGWGNLNQSLDFGKTPFPQIRAMLLVFLTAITAVSFFKKVTI